MMRFKMATNNLVLLFYLQTTDNDYATIKRKNQFGAINSNKQLRHFKSIVYKMRRI